MDTTKQIRVSAHAERRRALLARVIEHARAFCTLARPEDLASRAGEVHARPCANGIALVSLAPSSPQLGRSRLSPSHAAELLRTFDVGDRTPGRPTPEKALQSAIVSNAYRSEHRLRWLERANEETWFVTEELALPDDDGEKLVCDLVAVGRRGDRMVPVVIELKTERQMKRLIHQVSTYARLVDRERDLFADLASTVLGRRIDLDGPSEAWIVWPSSGRSVDPRAAELTSKGIRTLGFELREGRYAFV